MVDISFPAYAILFFTIIYSLSILPLQAEKEKDGFVLNQPITEILDKQRIHEANIVLPQKQIENQANQIAELQELQKVIKNKVNQKFELEELRKVIKDQANQKAEFQELWKVIKDQANQKTELVELRKFIKDQTIQKTELEELRKVIKDQAIEIGNLKNMQKVLKDFDNEKTKIKAGTDINQNVKNSQSMQHEHIANYIPMDEKEQAGRVLHVNDSVQKTNQSLNHTSILSNKQVWTQISVDSMIGCLTVFYMTKGVLCFMFSMY